MYRFNGSLTVNSTSKLPILSTKKTYLKEKTIVVQSYSKWTWFFNDYINLDVLDLNFLDLLRTSP